MDSQLGHGKHHYGSGAILLVVVVLVIVLLLVWAFNRNDKNKKYHHRRSHSYDDCDKSDYSSDSRRYSDSRSSSRNSGSH